MIRSWKLITTKSQRKRSSTNAYYWIIIRQCPTAAVQPHCRRSSTRAMPRQCCSSNFALTTAIKDRRRKDNHLFSLANCRAFHDQSAASTAASSSSTCFWQANLPRKIFSMQHHQAAEEEWNDKDWQQVCQVYRRGRSVLYPHGLTNDTVEQGLQLFDRIADKLISIQPSNQHVDENNNSNNTKPPLLDDPWLVSAWRNVAVEEAERIPYPVARENLQHMIQRIDRYVERGILAWNPHMLIWILDAWQAMRSSCHRNDPPPPAEQALELVQQLTRDYAADRPASKYVITRLLQYLAQDKVNPDRANALVHQYLRQQEQLPPPLNAEQQQQQQHDELNSLDDHAYTAWVHVWNVSNRKDSGTQALQILRRAQKDQCAKGIVLYDIVLHALCRSNDTVQSAILWQELQALNLPVTADTWHPLLQAYLRTPAWRHALQLWRACQAHVKTNVCPHRTARNTLTKTLERDLQQWDVFSLPHGQDDSMYLPDRIDNWDRVAEEWHVRIQAIRESNKNPSHVTLAAALSFLDNLCLAAFLEPPSWTVSARGGALDFLMDGIAKSSSLSPTEVAWTAESLLEDVVEDCEHDVHHPDFINKLPLLRLIKMWSETPESPAAAEVVWERLWRWYEESGGNKRFYPDENFYKALLRAWMVSSTRTPQETAQRAFQLWQQRVEQAGQKPSVEFSHQVATALAEAGDVESTKSLVNEVIESYRSGKTHERKDLDFVSLLILAKCRSGQLLGAAQTLDDLERLSRQSSDPFIRPSNFCYNTLLEELAEGDEIGNALAVLKRMAELASTDSTEPNRKIHPSVSSWMTFLVALAKSDSIEAADKAEELLTMSGFLQERFGTTVAPDLFMYNCILECFLRNPDPQKFIPTAESFVLQMENNFGGVKPDAETYELFLHLLVKAQLAGKASRYLERFCRLSQKGVVPTKPSTSHFHTVILGFLQIGDPQSITTAFGLVQLMHSLAMKTDWLVRPKHETYRIILQGCKNSRADPNIPEKVLSMMEKNALGREDGPKPDTEMYVEIIACWASKGSPEALEHIQKFANHVPQHRIAQDSELYRIILNAYIRCGSTEMAQALSDAMMGIPGHCRVALEAWVEAKDYERAARVSEHLAHGESPAHLIRDSITIWRDSKLPGAGVCAERLLQYMEKTADKDYVPDESIYSDVLFSYHYAQDPDTVVAADRLVQRCRDTGGTSSVDLCFLEGAATVYLSQPDERTHERVIAIFEDIREVKDSEWFSKGKDVCSRLEAAIVESDVKTKSILLDKLIEVISCRTHLDENETPATLL
eukprot:scaffold1001_cov169-Amphora_coffeaeformis.AAC.23